MMVLQLIVHVLMLMVHINVMQVLLNVYNECDAGYFINTEGQSACM